MTEILLFARSYTIGELDVSSNPEKHALLVELRR